MVAPGEPFSPFPTWDLRSSETPPGRGGCPGGQSPVSSPGLPASGVRSADGARPAPLAPGGLKGSDPGLLVGQPAHPTKRRRGRGRESGCEGWGDLPHPQGQPHASQRRPRPLSLPVCTGAPGLGTTASPLSSDKELGHRGLGTTPRHQSRAHVPTGGGEGPAARIGRGEGPPQEHLTFSSRALGGSREVCAGASCGFTLFYSVLFYCCKWDHPFHMP